MNLDKSVYLGKGAKGKKIRIGDNTELHFKHKEVVHLKLKYGAFGFAIGIVTSVIGSILYKILFC